MDRLSLRRFPTISLDSPKASGWSSASSDASSATANDVSANASPQSHALRRFGPADPASRHSFGLTEENSVIALTIPSLREALEGRRPPGPFVAALKTIATLQSRGLLDADDNRLLATQFRQLADEYQVDLAALPGLEPAEQHILDAVMARAEQRKSSTTQPAQPPLYYVVGSASKTPQQTVASTQMPIDLMATPVQPATNMYGGTLLSPAQLATKLGLSLANKSKAAVDGIYASRGQGRGPSYVTSDSVPDKAWRVSPAFRHGSYKKIRLALDNDNKVGVFTVQYIEEATRVRPKSQHPLPLASFEQAEQMLKIVDSPLATAQGTEHAFVDQKGRVWNWRPFFSSDLFDLSAGLRTVSPRPDGAFLQLMLGMAEDVARIHEKHLMLLDIKAENFLFDPKHGIAFGDFDFARPTGTMENNTYCGTEGFMAPEMVEMMGRFIGRRADIFSLGQTFVQIVSGKELSIFDSRRPQDILQGFQRLQNFDVDARAASVMDPSNIPGSLPHAYNDLFLLNEWLADYVFDRMLHQDAAQRPTAKEVVAKLQELVSGPYRHQYKEMTGIEQLVDDETANLSAKHLLRELEARRALPSSSEA